MRSAVIVSLLLGASLAGCFGGSEDVSPGGGGGGAGMGETQRIDLPFLPPGQPLDLALDVPVSWVGPRVTNTFVAPLTPALRCEAMPDDPCLYYPIEVPEGAMELRAALDRPDHTNAFYLAFIDPTGSFHDADNGPYTLEVRAESPAPGTWTLRVDPIRVDDARFRLRVQAMSDDTVGQAGGTGPLLPNLAPIPAFDFHFDMPASQVGGSPSAPAGLVPSGCHPEEWVLNGYQERCLRFSFGWGNDGPGTFDALIGEPPAGSLTAPVTQRIHHHDGTHEDRSAGTATVHKTHGHYHLDDVFEVEAFRVQGNELVSAELSAKRGSCMADYVFMNWTSWHQEPKHSAGSNCGGVLASSGLRAHPDVNRVAQTPGWGDIYFWELPDNYIVFDGQEDGEYVLRGTVDAAGVFAESDENDNVGYTHLLVQGSAVQVLERGYGLDPWDPDKEVIEAPWAT